MRLKAIKTIQVKCNFCFDWMRLNTQTRLNINVCDQCLCKASGPHNLSAISSSGQIYQFYMVKKNSTISTLKEQDHLTNWLQNFQREDDQNMQTNWQNLKTDFLEDIDQYRNSQIQQILLKWGLLTNFLKERQSLSNQDVDYLKKMCDKNINEHKQINEKLMNSFSMEQIQKQTQINVVQNDIKIQREPLSQIKIIDNQNITINISKPFENIKKLSQMKNQTTESLIFTSPKKVLKDKVLFGNEENFGLLAFSVQKLQLDQNTFHQDLSKQHDKFSDCDTSLNNSNITQGDLFLPLGSMKSSRHSLFLTTLSKRTKEELIKTYQLVRQRISKFLLQKYESSSLTRLMFSLVFEAFENTSTIGKSLQLVAYNLSFLDFGCYLQAFDWSNVQIIKFVKVKLRDEQLKTLVQFLCAKNIFIKTLVLTSNKLTQASLAYFQNNKIQGLQQIYLGKNRIKKFQVRRQIASLRENYRLHL